MQIAYEAMSAHGLEPEFNADALNQSNRLSAPPEINEGIKDLTDLPWCSIDNDDSRDLDQLTVAHVQENGTTLLQVAIADVDTLVKKGTPIDDHARNNTTSIYTGVKIFPMLPERLSTDLTSLGPFEFRLAMVVEMTVDSQGQVTASRFYRARVKNQAKLAYSGVGAWLEERAALPDAAARVHGMDDQLKLQDKVAQKMRDRRHEHGALELETIEPKVIASDGSVLGLKQEQKNRAHELIEDFMIATNSATAEFLNERGIPNLRRVVKRPEKWPRIVEVAKTYGENLPPEPDSKALAGFLSRRRKIDPLRFPDLSLTIIKLLGRGTYEVQFPGTPSSEHFGLAARDYTHSTAPNRRFPDLITLRLTKAALSKAAPPYSVEELQELAQHCTDQENAADKVERQVRKSAAAMWLSSRIAEVFDAIVTGAAEKGTWARAISPPVEGKIVQGMRGLNVGDRVRVRLLGVNVRQGWIDFAKV